MSHCIRALLAAAITLSYAAPSVRAGDKDTIDASIKALAAALRDGDSRSAKAYVLEDDGDQQLIESLVKLSKWSQELHKAAVAQFGKEGKDVADGGHMAENLPYVPRFADLDQNQIAIHGNVATVPPKSGTHTFSATMRKAGGTWKLDLEQKGNAAYLHARTVGRMADVLLELTGDIKEGKYHTAKAAQRAFVDKMGKAIQNS